MIYTASLVFDKDEEVQGNISITTLRELYKVGLDPAATKLVIRHCFAEEYFMPLTLDRFRKEFTMLYPSITLVIESPIVQYREDIINTITTSRRPGDVAYFAGLYGQDFVELLKDLVNSYKTTSEEILTSNNKLSNAMLTIERLQDELHQSDLEKGALSHLNSEYKTRLDILYSQINHGANIKFDESKILDTNARGFKKIIYIKEITRVHKVDTLVYYFREIMRTLYDMPVRFVVIEPYTAYDRHRFYPDTKSFVNLTYTDIMQEDIYMAGYQKDIFEVILNNTSNVSHLLVLDRGGYAKPHLKGDQVELIYSVADIADIYHNTPLNRVISYSEHTLNIPYVRDWDTISEDRKIGIYSSMPIMNELIKLVEGETI